MFRYVLQLAKESLLEVRHAKEFRRDNLFCHVRLTFPAMVVAVVPDWHA